MSSDLAINVSNVSKVYRLYDNPVDRLVQMLSLGKVNRFREFSALQPVTFDIKKGESVGILGANGSGKSTLLQMIAGTVQPTTGTISRVGRLSALLELGAGFNPEFTGIENVFMNGAILGLSDGEIRDRLDDILAFADIGDFVNHPVKTYSSGMYVRLAFAVAVNVSPDILIIDEALAVGDNLFQKRCFAKIEELLNRNVTLLFVSHDQESVRTLTSRALVLDGGRAMYWGKTAEGILRYREILHDKETAYLSRLGSRTQEHKVVDHEKTGEAESLGRSEALRFGDNDATVESVEILGDDNGPKSIFRPGEILRIKLEITVNRAISNLNVGVRIRNKQGIKIYSSGTLNQDLAIWDGLKSGQVFWDRAFSAGDQFSVVLECPVRLGDGFYEVQSYVSHEPDKKFAAQRILDWCDEAAFFTVRVPIAGHFFGGICDMQMVAKYE